MPTTTVNKSTRISRTRPYQVFGFILDASEFDDFNASTVRNAKLILQKEKKRAETKRKPRVMSPIKELTESPTRLLEDFTKAEDYKIIFEHHKPERYVINGRKFLETTVDVINDLDEGNSMVEEYVHNQAYSSDFVMPQVQEDTNMQALPIEEQFDENLETMQALPVEEQFDADVETMQSTSRTFNATNVSHAHTLREPTQREPFSIENLITMQESSIEKEIDGDVETMQSASRTLNATNVSRIHTLREPTQREPLSIEEDVETMQVLPAEEQFDADVETMQSVSRTFNATDASSHARTLQGRTRREPISMEADVETMQSVSRTFNTTNASSHVRTLQEPIQREPISMGNLNTMRESIVEEQFDDDVKTMQQQSRIDLSKDNQIMEESAFDQLHTLRRPTRHEPISIDNFNTMQESIIEEQFDMDVETMQNTSRTFNATNASHARTLQEPTQREPLSIENLNTMQESIIEEQIGHDVETMQSASRTFNAVDASRFHTLQEPTQREPLSIENLNTMQESIIEEQIGHYVETMQSTSRTFNAADASRFHTLREPTQREPISSDNLNTMQKSIIEEQIGHDVETMQSTSRTFNAADASHARTLQEPTQREPLSIEEDVETMQESIVEEQYDDVKTMQSVSRISNSADASHARTLQEPTQREAISMEGDVETMQSFSRTLNTASISHAHTLQGPNQCEAISMEDDVGTMQSFSRTLNATNASRAHTLQEPTQREPNSIEENVETMQVLPAEEQFDEDVETMQNFSRTFNVTNASRLHIDPLQELLQQCGQTEELPFDMLLGKKDKPTKLGEGSFGEVYKARINDIMVALKILPIASDDKPHPVNGDFMKTARAVLPEAIISKHLSQLATNVINRTEGFVNVVKMAVVKGQYPKKLLDCWSVYKKKHKKKAINDSPELYSSDNQLYLAIALENGGDDLEKYKVKKEDEALSILIQLIMSLRVAEKELRFEHRDLHIGNLLVMRTPIDDQISYRLDGTEFYIKTFGIKATIIDFTNSRATLPGNKRIFLDLSTDTELFEGKDDYQFDIYRMMKDLTGNNWAGFNPKTNNYWVHYMSTKLFAGIRVKRRKVLQPVMDMILNCEDLEEFCQLTDVKQIFEPYVFDYDTTSSTIST